MSVTNGQIANQTTFNNAFVSKQSLDQDVDGTINLKNADSGADVVNVQQEINNIKTVNSNQDGAISSAQSDLDSAINTSIGSLDGGLLLRTDVDGFVYGMTRWAGPNYPDDTNALARFGPTYGGEIYYNTTTNKYRVWSVSLGDFEDLSAGVSAAEDITFTPAGGVSSTDVQSAIEEIDLAATKKETLTTKGDIYVATASGSPSRLGVGSDGEVLTADSSEASGLKWSTISSGSGDGDVNFIQNGKAELDVSGWATYADAASSRPVDGTGGTASITLTRSTTSPLDDDASFVFTKDASDRQGEGASTDFTIPLAYRAKQVKIEADYIVGSGSFTAGSSTTDSDLIFYIYDVDAAQLIEPSSFKLLSNSAGVSDKFSASFQTSATSSNYRLILHVATTNSNAWSLKLDNIKVTPSKYVFGSPVTDWQSFTPTGTWTTNTTYSGKWRRVGDSAEIQFKAALSGAPNATQLIFNMPPGLTIDTAKLTDTTNFITGSTTSYYDQSASAFYVGTSYYITNTTIAPFINLANSTYDLTDVVSNIKPVTAASGDTVTTTINVPIVGWSSSVQMSDSADTRVVAFRSPFTSTSLVSSGSLSDMNIGTPTFDTHGIAGVNLLRIPSYGFYKFNLSATSATSATGVTVAGISVNGVDISEFIRIKNESTTSLTTDGGTVLQLNAGDIIRVRALQNSGGTVSISTALTVEKISGPSAIAASEKVVAKYRTTAGQNISNVDNTLVQYNTKIYDSHNSITTGSGWKFTAPIAGEYKITAFNTFVSATYATGNYVALVAYKNGSVEDTINFIPTVAAFTGVMSAFGSTTINLNAGEYIDIRSIAARTAGTTNLNTNGSDNYIVIERIK